MHNTATFILVSTGWTRIDTDEDFCRTTNYLRRSGKTWSAMLTLLLTVERYLCVAHPFKVALRSRTLAVVLIVLSVAISFALPVPLIQYDVVYDFLLFCMVEPTGEKFYDDYDLIAIRIFGEGVIGVLIFFFTCLMIHSLVKAKQNSQQMNLSAEAHKARSRQDSQLNSMLLFIVFMFFVTRLPYTICYFLYTYNAEDGFLSQGSVRYTLLAVRVTRAFSIFNFSTNFLIYVAFVRTFRANLCALCLCCRRRSRDGSIWTSSGARSTKNVTR